MSDESTKEAMSIVPVNMTEGLEQMAEYEAPSGIYRIFGVPTDDGVGPLVATEVWRLYVAQTPTGQIGLMKVSIPENPDSVRMLNREVRILRTIQTVAQQIDDETEGSQKPFHGANFMTVLETIQPEEDKLVVFLGFHSSVLTYRQLMPVSLLGDRRIDMQTSAWMLGKMLKSLVFVHELGFGIGFVDASNIFLETDVHGVLFMDLSSVNEEATPAEQIAEVAAVASIIWWAVGGSATSEPPHDASIMTVAAHAEFVSHLRRMMDAKTDSARAEHVMLYTPDVGLADRTWSKVPISDGSGMKRPFHPYVTYPRS